DRGDVQERDVVQAEDELDGTGPPLHIRVGDTRVKYRAAIGDEKECERRQSGAGDPTAPSAFMASLRCGPLLFCGKRYGLLSTHFVSLILRNDLPSAS